MSDLEAAPEAALPAGPPAPAEPPVPDLAGARSVEAASQKPEEASFSAPLNLAVEDVNDSSVTLTWDAPENVGPSGLDGYVVEYCKDGATEWVTANNKPFLSIRYIIRSLISGEKLHIRVKAVKGNAISQPAFLDQPVLIREILEEPKIRLPRYLRELYLRTVGDVINLLIPFRGKPKPQVTWTKEGQPLDPKQVVVRNTEKDSVFFIRAAQRKDSGKYQISVKILDELEDVATFDLQVIERPGSPENLKVVDVWGFNVALEWSPPQDKGNADLKGYTVQKADMKTKQWFTVLEHYNHTNCTVSDLIIGNSYSFRVFSENACGLSEMPAVTNDVTHITKSAQSDLDENQKEIQEDPRYLVHMNQGICCLEIRKPSPFDGGVYTCKAVNPLGKPL